MSTKHIHTKLNQFYATAISGNDILSSALYVSGIACIFAGVFAPVVLAVIAVVLFFYKSVYIEVVEALPINGGAYNCLLNGTSKIIAAVAGVTTVLSYIATAVISAKVAVEYLSTVLTIPVIPLTIGVLLVFAVLVISGIKDSAKVAFGIFSFHILTLVSFVVLGIFFITHGHSIFWQNFEISRVNIGPDGIIRALFLGFSASLLGVSGFESSANFVEEQQPGVFRKTLRNMLVGVAIFNPLIAFISICVATMPEIVNAKEFLLADEAHILGGSLFQYIVVTDAFLVLSGAVLTAYVGVSGLVYRMASDACLPNFLTKINSKGSYPRIVIGFFLLCTSILLLTNGNLLSLAGVYTIAFLSVMSLFALGNLILRETRTELKRTYHAYWLFVIVAFFATITGIIGNIEIDPNNFAYFSFYFIPAAGIVTAMVFQDSVMKFLLRATRDIPPLHRYLMNHFEDMTGGELVAFINHPDRIHKILSYIDRNETAWNITLVHCKNWDNKSDEQRHGEIEEVLPYLKKAGVFPNFNIKLLYEDKPFGPEAIDEISRKLKFRKNRIMIGSIHSFHNFDYSDLGGVRIIF